MKLLQTIAEKAGERGLPFSIIGGYAVMARGFVRATDDLDLLVERSRRSDWRQLLEAMGMTIHREAPNFLQFNAAPGFRLPVDLMFVTDDVFARMQARREPTKVGNASVRVASLLHVVALKCHATQSAKQRDALRGVKDIEDLIQRIQIDGLDLNEQELRATILKHADSEPYENYDAPVPPTDASLHDALGELAFPDWSGALPNRSRMTPQEAFQWNEEMLALFPPKPGRSRHDEARNEAESVL